MSAPTMALYCGLLMAVSIGLVAWRMATAGGKLGSDADRMLGACVVASITLFVASIMPGAQLP